MPFCYLEGRRIFYERFGEGAPIVLVHGAGQDTTSWRYNIPFFAETHAVYAIDLPGHGKSEVVLPPIKKTEKYARFVWEFIEELEIRHPVLMGHSMGAGICMTVALEHGENVGGVVPVDGADKVVGVFASEIHQAYLESPLDLKIEMTMESFRSLCSKTTPAARIEEIAQDLLRIHPEVTAADTQAFNSFDICNTSHRIGVPVLLISGADDFLVTPDMVRGTGKKLKNSQVVILDGVGHFPHTEAPERFNEAVGRFLKSLQSQKA
ncbi:MAG: alpha/beta hydrolase [Candidatus Abyssobacteria bacterium SURF_5]|uniref:Alpha/beta hydrolase n=1 Tax=Abyssobacteria bacterium (strain SURF_5) TaxID=2093360 RepID=A0A3A4NK27_ABYX5|nr:MAG: alpha/beta hydrolase [Candidatus Abyssubacteria bacterium SURF_5]